MTSRRRAVRIAGSRSRDWRDLGGLRSSVASAVIGAAVVGVVGAVIVRRRRRRGAATPATTLRSRRLQRNADLARLGASVGSAYVGTAARKLFASTQRRIELDRELELRTADAVAERLGNMKGALMKLGQMASYVSDGLPAPMRDALSTLQSNAPAMSAELAAGVITEELGGPPSSIFVEWDPVPIAAASIGQVHRAIIIDRNTGAERAVAVKVQYPGVGAAIESDLRNADLLGVVLRQGFAGLDPDEMVAEVKERLVDELDYRLEARNQQQFAEFFAGHPFIHVPTVVPHLSTTRVITSELVTGSTWAELLTWDQHQRDLAGECLFRFVFRSLYGMYAFNGDPHPGNYLFHRDGRITFLDFGLVKHFTDAEMHTFIRMVKAAAFDHDPSAFRNVLEESGMLLPGAPVDDQQIGDYFGQFYESVRDDAPIQWTTEYASRIVRHTFDRTSPISQYATVPRQFVFIQRINLGLYALLGELRASGNYRRMAEELWPFTAGAPSTPMAEAEQEWLAGLRTGVWATRS